MTKGLIPNDPTVTARYLLSLEYKGETTLKTWLWCAESQRWKSVAKFAGNKPYKFSYLPKELSNTLGGGWKIVKQLPLDGFENTGYAEMCYDMGNW